MKGLQRIMISTGTATIVAVAGASSVAGQAPASARDQARPSEKLTMLGCVERADQFSPSGTPSAIASTADSQSFVLIKAEPPAPAAPSTANPVGTSGRVATGDAVKQVTSAIGKVYKLEGQRETLNTHVGHKVEVVGTLDPASTAARPPDSQNPSAATSPVLMVESVKMIAEMCPR